MGEHLLVQYGYILVFLGSVVEGDATLLAASFLANRGHFNLIYVMLVAGVGSTLFNEAAFHTARRAGKPFLERKAAKHKRYNGVQEWVCRRSVILLLFSRYVYGFRMAIPIACGAVGMRPLLFAVVNAAGAVLWVVPVCIAGYAFGHLLSVFWAGVRYYEWHIAVALLVLLTAVLAWFDPELDRVSRYILDWREAAVRSEARVRRLLSRVARVRRRGRRGDDDCRPSEKPL
jgi:membrane protein DedA with SNARE-associated domain